MRRIEIDFPLRNENHNYEELEVICKQSPAFDRKIAGKRLYDFLMSMPVSTLTEVFENPEFQELYKIYTSSR